MVRSVQQIHDTMRQVLTAKGYTTEDTEFIIAMYLGGELRGHVSHGLADFSSFVSKDFSQLDAPTIVRETESLYMVDAKSNAGVLIGRVAADQAILRAQKQTIGVALIKNMESWLRPGGIAQYIADKGYVAVVINDGGGTSIAPPGGYDPTLGTNPIAYGIPMAGTSLVVDMATSKSAWGQVRLANKYGTDLPKDTFYDEAGSLTVDPKKAHSVVPFGDYKGYALALLVEVLCGSLIGKGMMIASDAGNAFGAKFPDRGGLILVIDPSQTVGLEEFRTQNTEMVDRIHATRPLAGQKIRIPGEEAGKRQQASLASDSVEIPDEIWQELNGL